jgi:hypothetical protein
VFVDAAKTQQNAETGWSREYRSVFRYLA